MKHKVFDDDGGWCVRLKSRNGAKMENRLRYEARGLPLLGTLAMGTD